MGMNLGFLKYARRTSQLEEPLDRIKHYNEFHLYLSNEEQAEQAARCMDCGVPYCQYGHEIAGKTVGCPLGNLVPEFNDLLYQGKYKAAYSRLIKTNNFPEFTSRVCPALCEKACTCSLDGESVTTHENEFAIIENAFDSGLVKPMLDIPRTGKRVAVIGSGPSGLAAAAQLNMRGHTVHVYERSDRPGGLLMYGIPNMKLEKQVVMRRINLMEREGIRFYTGKNINTKRKADDLVSAYDAVVLCCGASQPRDMKVEGRDADGIYFAVDFLTSTTKSLLDHDLKEGTYISAKDKDVVIIGSGDTANDCLATVVRHGAKSVLQMQRHERPPLKRAAGNPWPEYPNVYVPGYGQEEAAAVYGKEPSIYGATVNKFIKDENGKLSAVEIIRMKSVKDEKTGRERLEKIEGSEETVPAQMAIIAAGFTGAENSVTKAFGVETGKRGTVAVESGHYATSRDKVFTAGDMRRGASLVVWAIKEGREAAREVDKFLNGYTNL
ncbi:MAG: glutamate synthase subunit beta [Anaerovoracaceae bacterium]|jgi:glutamate synthase (NADPH/NADH) small chain